MRGLLVDGDIQATIVSPLEQGVKKGEASVSLDFHGEPDGGSHTVEVGQESFHRALLHDTAGVVHVPLPEPGFGHAWENHHPIKWEEATVIDQARTHKELLLKEAIHIRLLHPHLNRDGGLELPGCWVALKGTVARVNRRQCATSSETT